MVHKSSFYRHKLRAEVEVEDVSKEFSTWQRYGGPLLKDTPDTEDPELRSSGWGAEIDIAAQASNEGNNEGFSWFRDPRCSALGFRGIFPYTTLRKSFFTCSLFYKKLTVFSMSKTMYNH